METTKIVLSTIFGVLAFFLLGGGAVKTMDLSDDSAKWWGLGGLACLIIITLIWI